MAVIEQSARMDVAVLDAGPDEHGLTMRDPRRKAVFIGVARTDRPMRQRSTLAHELAHVIFGDWTAAFGDQPDRAPAEIRADAFARHLLLPVAGLRESLGELPSATLATLSAVVQRYLVSPAVAAIALEEAGYIDLPTKREWMTTPTRGLAVRFGWGDQYRALQADSNRRRAPQRLLTRAIQGFALGVLPAQAVATLLGVPAEQVTTELREAGIVAFHPAPAWAGATDLPTRRVDLDELDADLDAPEPEVR